MHALESVQFLPSATNTINAIQQVRPLHEVMAERRKIMATTMGQTRKIGWSWGWALLLALLFALAISFSMRERPTGEHPGIEQGVENRPESGTGTGQ